MIALAAIALSFSLYQAPAVNACAHGYAQNVWDPRFSPGQRWSYRNRPQDKDSILTIFKIDDIPDIGMVVHIKVDNVSFDQGHNTHTEYFAIRRDSLDASALEMRGITQVPSTPNLYAQWQENCGGLTYSGTVADTVRALQEADLARRRTATFPIVLRHIALQQIGGAAVPPERFTAQITFHPYEGSSSGTLSGEFTSQSKLPLKGATVELSLLPSYNYSMSPQPPIVLKLNADGKFDSPMLPEGLYAMRLTVDGFIPDTRNVHLSSAMGIRGYANRKVYASAH